MTIEGDFCDCVDFNYAMYGYAQAQEGASPQEAGTQTEGASPQEAGTQTEGASPQEAGTQTVYFRTSIKETSINNPSFVKTAALSTREAPAERKALTAFNRTMGCAMVQTCSNVEAKVEASWVWGGREGFSFEMKGSASAYDDNGTYIKGIYSHKDDGTNNVNITGGYDDNGQDLGRSCDRYHGSD